MLFSVIQPCLVPATKLACLDAMICWSWAEGACQFGPFWWGGLHTHGHGMTQLKNAHTLLSTRLGEATQDLRPHMQRVCASLAAALDEEEA